MADNRHSGAFFYRFGPFYFDSERLLLYRQGELIPLPPRLIRALSIFVQNQGKNLGKDYLVSQLWPDTAVEENNLTVIISGLRKVFGDDPEQHKYIVTIPGHGYRFVANVRREEDFNCCVDESSDQPAASSYTVRNAWIQHLVDFAKSAKQLMVVFALLLLAAGGFVVWPDRHGSNTQAHARYSIAILPFAMSGNSPEQDYLGVGMADGLVTRLRNNKEIYVLPSEEVLRYHHFALNPEDAGRMLNVGALVTGTLQQADGRIKISVSVIDTQDASVLWSQDYSAELKELLSAQNRIAEDIRYALTLSPRNLRSSRHYVPDPEAYRLYLEGVYFTNHRSHDSAEASLKKAVSFLEAAVKKDPQFATAYSALANAYNRLSWYLPAEESFAKAGPVAEKALSLNSNLAAAHRALALVKQAYEWDLVGADREYQRAIELDPQDATTHRWYSEALLASGRFQEAETEARKAQQIDPSSMLYDTLGKVFFYSRKYREAYIELQGKEDVDPEVVWYRTWIQQFQRDGLAVSVEKFDTMDKNIDQHGSEPCEFAYLAVMHGKKPNVNECVHSFKSGSSPDRKSAYQVALLYLALGNKDEALQWLERARLQHDWNIPYLTVDPRLDDIRELPNFKELLAASLFHSAEHRSQHHTVLGKLG